MHCSCTRCFYLFLYSENLDGSHIVLSRNHLLLRGCILRNTDFVIGMVVYAGEYNTQWWERGWVEWWNWNSLTSINIEGPFDILCTLTLVGYETKSMLNNTGHRAKRSKLERAINTEILSLFLILLTLSVIGAISKLYFF